MGVNLPVMLVKYLAGEGYAEMPKKIDHSATYVNERMCRDDWYQGKISTKEYHSIIESSDISFVNDDKDTEPQKVYDKHFARLKAKRIVRLVLKTNR